MSKFAIAYHERLGLWSRVSCNTAVYADMLSHQYGNTFNFNFLILYQCYCKSKTSSEKLRFKPSSGHLDFDFFSKIRLVFRLAKDETKRKFFYTRNLLFVRIFAFNQNICGFGQFLYEFLSFGNALRLPWCPQKAKFAQKLRTITIKIDRSMYVFYVH